MTEVLLVDDDRPTVRLISLTLGMDDYSVEVAPTRDEALALISERGPDIVVMDYLMPGLDASTFLTKIREGGYCGRVVLCTALDRDVDLEVDAVIKKPFDPRELVKLVGSLMEG